MNFVWLSLSLFCAKNNWNKLLGEGIEPFVEGQKLITNYTISFNFLSGENIRLSLQVNSEDAPEVAKCADAYFKNYFSFSKFPVKKLLLPVDGVFLPMPMNTIQYGLYSVSAKTQAEISYLTNVSKILITALKCDSIDDEAIITFAFYLQVGLTKVIGNQIKSIVDLMSIIKPKEHAATEMQEEIILDEALLNEITLDIMQTEEFDIELNWLNTWIDLNRRALNEANNYAESIEDFYHNKVSVIHTCMGINSNCKLLLTNSVQNALAQYFAL